MKPLELANYFERLSKQAYSPPEQVTHHLQLAALLRAGDALYHEVNLSHESDIDRGMGRALALYEAASEIGSTDHGEAKT